MAVFQNDLSDYLVALFTSEMGVGSAYTTMKAQTINKRIFADPNEWPYWTLPAVSVACHRTKYQADGQDGNFKQRYNRIYQCMVVGLIDGKAGEIDEPVREFYERMELIVSARYVTVNSAGVLTRGRMVIKEGYTNEQMYTNDSTDSTKRIGVAVINFEIEAGG